MKRSINVCMVLALVFGYVMPVSAQTPADKLGRGLSNTLVGILALPQTMQKEQEANGIMAGLTTGTVKGLGNFVLRELVGVYEIVTFLFPLPAGYRPILDDPEYLLK